MNLPQTFQGPNEYVDYFCSRLTGAEFKLLMIASRKICGYAHHRETMRDRISLSQFSKLSGIVDRATLIKSLDHLSEMGLLKKVGKSSQVGQEWKLVRHLPKVGQQELALDLPKRYGNPTKVVGKPYHLGRETLPTKPITKPILKNVNVTDETPLKNQSKKLETNEEIVAHLRSLAVSGNGEADPASKTLMLLEQLWEWNQKTEIKKSWVWFQMAARKYPQAFDRAFGEVKERMVSSTQTKLRAPGAYMTTLIKNYAGIV